MKENTAAVHVQVPVDVATFLLNEKRNDIAKHRGATQRVDRAASCPTSTWRRRTTSSSACATTICATPTRPSPATTMAEKPKAEGGVGRRRKEREPARQEAAVKGITPAQPARWWQHPCRPLVGSGRRPAASGGGLLGKLFGWLVPQAGSAGAGASRAAGGLAARAEREAPRRASAVAVVEAGSRPWAMAAARLGEPRAEQRPSRARGEGVVAKDAAAMERRRVAT
jgi:ribonuclease E